jgi:hypothetical protein
MALLAFSFSVRGEKPEVVGSDPLFEEEALMEIVEVARISSSRVVVPQNFDPEQGYFYSIGSAGVQVFASGEDGALYAYDPGSTEVSWVKVESLNRDDILYVSGFGSNLVVLTKSGDVYKYHWTADEAKRFLPTTVKEKEAKIEKKKVVKTAAKKTAKVKPGKSKKAVATGKKAVKKRETVGGRVKKVKRSKAEVAKTSKKVSKVKRAKVKKIDIDEGTTKGSPAKSRLRRY